MLLGWHGRITDALSILREHFNVKRVVCHQETGGRQRGEKLLTSFLERRCVGYQYNISSPNTAPRACSRLSPHIAYGTLSLREIYQGAKTTGLHNSSLPRKKKSLSNFRSRLHWHCHFIQKLEDEPELEFRAMHREMEELKSGPDNSERLQRWQEGQTGWPLVDACMRALHYTGRIKKVSLSAAGFRSLPAFRKTGFTLPG